MLDHVAMQTTTRIHSGCVFVAPLQVAPWVQAVLWALELAVLKEQAPLLLPSERVQTLVMAERERGDLGSQAVMLGVSPVTLAPVMKGP